MGREGSVYRRCTGCRQRVTGPACPCGHGRSTWTFVVDVAPSGTTGRQQVKRGGFLRKQDALDAMHGELVDRGRGNYVERNTTTFGEYARHWLHDRAGARLRLGRLAETTWAIYERDLRNHLLPELADISIQELDGNTLTRHYTALLDTLSPKTIANVHGLAHRILADAVQDDVLIRNPADRAVKPRATETEHPTWTAAEVASFLAHVRERDPDWHTLYALIATTGIRRGEAIGATWAALDLDEALLEIRQSITKAGSKVVVKEPKSIRSRRHVPLVAPVLDLLGEHRVRQDQQRRIVGRAWQDRDLVFTNGMGRYVYPDYVSTKFSTSARECGLPHIGGPHGLRHSLASALDANGSGLATISALLGHASTAVTSKVYTHMLKGADRAAVDAHAAALFTTEHVTERSSDDA